MGFMAYINPVEQEYKNALDDQKILGVKLPKEGRLFKIKINQTKNPQLIYLLWNNKDDANSIYKEIKDEDTKETVPNEIFVIFDECKEDYILQSQKDRQLYIVNKNRILKVID